MKTKLLSRISLGAVALLVPVAAEAHPGHSLSGHPFLSGALHPLTGADHLAAMVMVGLWSGILSNRARWSIPAAFVGAMVAGFCFGLLAQPSSVGVEWVIVSSVVALGCAVALGLRMRLGLVALVATAFGFAHGLAHGAEAPAGEAASFALGFVLATASLHSLGLVLARRLPMTWTRVIGVMGAGFGLLLASL